MTVAIDNNIYITGLRTRRLLIWNSGDGDSIVAGLHKHKSIPLERNLFVRTTSKILTNVCIFLGHEVDVSGFIGQFEIEGIGCFI